MPVIRGSWPGSSGMEWIDPPGPGGKRRQQRPALPAEVMAEFLSWRKTMLQLIDRCRASAPKLAQGATSLLEDVVLPERRRVGALTKRSVVEHRVHRGWLLSEWGVATPPPDAPPDAEPEPSACLYLLTDGRVVLRRSGADARRRARLVDDADFVQIVHRDGLIDQLRRRLVALFREAELSPPVVPKRPRIDHADVWGKVARPSRPPAPENGPPPG